MIKDYAINPNPDFIHRKKVEEEIKNNGGFCISALQHNKDTVCICKEFKEQNHSGWCKCGQFYKVLKSPKVCLCGSSRFKDKFFEVAQQLTEEGYNVSLPVIFELENFDNIEINYLREVYKAKIADADLLYVINCDGYIGNTTREEINWAIQLGKKVQYLES